MNRIIIVILFFLLVSCEEKIDPIQSHSETQPKSNSETHAVIEIPAGTLDKFELNKKTKSIEHEHKNGKPRVVQYLAYPGNYGYIPNTLLSKKNGGDGDPLDVIVLGAAVKRNDTLPIKIIGALKLLDRGEQDDKLIAVSVNTPFSEVKNMIELDEKFHGVSKMIDIWFTNYKGIGKMETQGFIDQKAANKVLELAQNDYKNSSH